MSQLNTASKSARQWVCPIQLSSYNRSPVLTRIEAEALDELVGRYDRGSYPWPGHLVSALERLTVPINDVLDITTVGMKQTPGIIAPLMRVMNRKRTTFWGFRPDDWTTMLSPRGNPSGPKIYHNTRQYLIATAYYLGDFTDFQAIVPFRERRLANKVFGPIWLESKRRIETALAGWGYGSQLLKEDLPKTLSLILLMNRSPLLEDLSAEALDRIQSAIPANRHYMVDRIRHALVELKLIENLEPGKEKRVRIPRLKETTTANISPEWLALCKRWLKTTGLGAHTRNAFFYLLLKVGRWLNQEHPEINSPAQWTYELAADFVAALQNWSTGDFAVAKTASALRGKPLAARTTVGHLNAVRIFFGDLHEWGLIPYRFDPVRAFQIPTALNAQLKVNPRLIDEAIWAKLMNAGLTLTDEDLPGNALTGEPAFPLEFFQAVAIVWLFSGLRSDEIRRLPVGCIRWVEDISSGGKLQQEKICWLDVPVNKTGSAFTKPVDEVVGHFIEAWEHIRPPQPSLVDPKTGKYVDFLFCYRSRQVGTSFINSSIIPMLCRKAGVPERDSHGPITSHRARSTIASQLYNAKQPMSLVELQEWLGHSTPAATQHYTKLTPTRLARSYQQAGYFARNVRTIEVLIDQEAVLNGDPTQGLPWKYYDLGHGYCTYDFFEQCEHRMACARCDFYRPKTDYLELLLEKKAHLLHMRQDIPLAELELATVEGDLEATEKLIARLVDVPTPAGCTPRQIAEENSSKNGRREQASGKSSVPTHRPVE